MTDQFINSSGEVLAELDTAGTARLPMRRGVSEEFFQGALATQRAVEAVLRHIDTSTNNTQPKENQMIESSDEELAEAIDEAHRELDALRPGNYQPNSLNTGDQGRVLPTAARNVDGQRRADYGPALESFQRIADIANAGLGHKLAEDLTPEDICWLLLYALKGSRAAQGLRTGTFHHDTYADTAGYAAVAEIIHLQREGENA